MGYSAWIALDLPELLQSIVRVPFVTALWAVVEDSAAFVCRAQLLGVIAHFFAAALFAGLSDRRIGLHVCLGNFLHI